MNDVLLESFFRSIREDFPMLKKSVHGNPFIYFDSAATAHKPYVVIERLRRFYAEEYATVHRGVYETSIQASALYHESRSKIRQFLNAALDEEIIFTRGTTDSINLVSNSFCRAFVQAGDEIIISEMEHHSNLVPWQMACEQTGARLRIIPFQDNGELDLTVLDRLLTPHTKLVAIAHISNTLGTLNPIQEICGMAHRVGAKVLVDGAQSAPHIPVDVQKLGVDFFACSGHKLFGPTGIGILYGKQALLNAMPPYQGGGDMIETVTLEHTTYNSLPLKFEAGTPIIAEVIGLGAAIDYLTSIGLQKIAAWESSLLSCLMEELKSIPAVRILGNAAQKGSVALFHVEGVHSLDIATLLDLKGIAIRSGHLCAQPVMRHYGISTACRVSLAFYNTKEEIRVFIKHLAEVLQHLQP